MTSTMPSRHETVAARVRGFMAERQFNQLHLAEVLNIAQTNASKRYRGKRAYSINELDTIAGWLEVRIEDLFRSSSPEGTERRVRTGWTSRARVLELFRPTFCDMPQAA